MLLLERCRNAAVCIGNDVRVKVLRTGKQRVLLGIEAARDIPIWREELGPPRPSPESRQDPSQHNGLALSVLVVQDDPVHGKLIPMIRTRCGDACVEVVASGEAALQLLRQGNGHAFPHRTWSS